MVLYLTTSQYNGIAALTDTVGSLSLSWIEFMEQYGVTVRPNDLLANQQNQNPFFTHIHIPASQWAQAIPLINSGVAAGGGPAAFYTILAYLFSANIIGVESSGGIIPFVFEPQFTYEYAEPINQNANFYAVFYNMRASQAATFALYYIDGVTLINTQNVTTDANGTAVVTFNTGVLSGTPTEMIIKVTQQTADMGSNMRGVINTTMTLFAALS
jgi:hypothetical protein